MERLLCGPDGAQARTNILDSFPGSSPQVHHLAPSSQTGHCANATIGSPTRCSDHSYTHISHTCLPQYPSAIRFQSNGKTYLSLAVVVHAAESPRRVSGAVTNNVDSAGIGHPAKQVRVRRASEDERGGGEEQDGEELHGGWVSFFLIRVVGAGISDRGMFSVGKGTLRTEGSSVYIYSRECRTMPHHRGET